MEAHHQIDGGKRSNEIPRITIEVSGGMVQNVYTTLESDVEVEILDFDDNGTLSEEGRENMGNYVQRVTSEQRQRL